MPPRLNSSTSRGLARALRLRRTTAQSHTSPINTTTLLLRSAPGATRQYANAASPSISLSSLKLPDDYIPPTQPPSARRPDQRKAQLLRAYTAMLRSTPLILFFQHSNLTAVEWAAIRRELRAALALVPPPAPGPDGEAPPDMALGVEFQVLRTRIFDVAFKIVEYFDPKAQPSESNAYMHDLSTTAYQTIKKATISDTSAYGQIKPLFSGPLAAVTIPGVSPAHLEAALKVLAPSPPRFPPPPRKKNPGYYDPIAQSGLQKLLLIGGRIENKTFDLDGVKWVGSIEGGLDGLRAQLVALLQSAGLNITTALEGNTKGLWLALEGRRTQLEEEANGGKKTEETASS